MSDGAQRRELTDEARRLLCSTQSESLSLLWLEHELAVLEEEGVVHVDFATTGSGAQVADHVPMKGGDVFAAGLGIAVA